MKLALACAVALLTQAGAPWIEGEPDRVELAFDASGRIESERAYRDGHKVGRHRSFWPDGTLRVQADYERDAFHGAYRTFYSSGRPYELRHYDHGRESGLQQSWTETGELFLNYEVRDGRRYGLVNARPCEPVGTRQP